MENLALNSSSGSVENITGLNLSLRIPDRTDGGNAPLSSPVSFNAPWYTDAYDYSVINNPDGTQTLILRIYPYSFSSNVISRNLSFEVDYTMRFLMDLVKKKDGLGLNLISIPLNSSVRKASDLAKKIPGCEAVWHRVNNTYEGYPAIDNPGNELDFNLTLGEAYFISVSENITWELLGDEKMPYSINLSGGYLFNNKPVINLIEISIDSSITTAEDLAALIPGCNAPGQKTISGWDSVEQKFIPYISGQPFNNFEIIPGRGYIVSTCDNTTFVVQ